VPSHVYLITSRAQAKWWRWSHYYWNGWNGDWKWCSSFKKESKALVWKYFGFETDGNGRPLCVDLPKCHLCPSRTTVTAKDSNISNLYSHLKSKHLEEYALACQASKKKGKSFRTEEPAVPKLTLLDSWDKQRPLSSSSREHKTLTNAATYCLATIVHCRQARLPVYVAKV